MEEKHEKPVEFVGGSLRELKSFGAEVARDAGYQLYLVQIGQKPDDWKPVRSVGPGVCEIRIRDDREAYRVMYVANFEEAVYVLSAFRKTSSKTTTADLELAKARFKSIKP